MLWWVFNTFFKSPVKYIVIMKDEIYTKNKKNRTEESNVVTFESDGWW